MLKNVITLILLSVILMVLTPYTAPFGFFFIGWLVVHFGLYWLRFRKSRYQDLTGNQIWKVYLDRGLYGEFLTVVALEGITRPDDIFVNVYLSKVKKADETTEIDVVYVNRSGIYVIESKNYSGWIFGNEKNQYWTQSLNRRTKNRFYNPVRQNNGHISTLINAVGEQYTDAMVNVVVFSERCELKKVSIESPNIYVFKRNFLRSFIKQRLGERQLTDDDIVHIHSVIEPTTRADETVKEKHIESIKKNLRRTPKVPQVSSVDSILSETNEEIEKQTDVQICPKCGCNMILRTATKGENKGNQFWGCSNFPKCRTVKEIEKLQS